MYKIFVSYAQPELRWAEYLKNHLAFNGVNVYVAEYDLPAGNNLSKDISDQIKNCDLFLLLWTGSAELSKYVSQELFLAKTSDRNILPILLQPGIALPQILGDKKYLDISKGPEEQLSWLRAFVEERAKTKQLTNVVTVGILSLLAAYAFGSKG